MKLTLATNSEFLKKILEIIRANLGDEKFGVNELAGKAGISTKTLNRRLHSVCNKSGNQLIREIRLQRAMELLQTYEATISEIAWNVGFGSSTYFDKCFREYYGFAPGEAKRRLAGENGVNEKIASETDNLNHVTDQQNLITSIRKIANNRRWLYLLSGLLLVFSIIWVINYFFTNDGFRNNRLKGIERSIAVLPFKNLSSEKETEWFADGVMEDILNHLLRIKDLRVISRTSVEQFRGNTLGVPEIAKKLDVNFILEGSVQRHGGRARINVQLIDALNDQHLWAGKYDRETSDVLSAQSEIARRIAEELQASLSPEENHRLEKIPVIDPEAYDLYLKGKFFLNKLTFEGFTKSIEYFEKAIAVDPSPAMFYSALSDALFLHSIWQPFPSREECARSKNNALHALEMDNTLTEAHAVLGRILFWNEWKWEEARKELEYTIELNPNYVAGRQYYAELLEILGEKEAAREQLRIALKLDPLSKSLMARSMGMYYREGKFAESLDEGRKLQEVYPEMDNYGWYFLNYIQLGEDDKACEALLNGISKDQVDKRSTDVVKEAYRTSGIQGLLDLLNKWEFAKSRPHPYYLAKRYALMGKNKEALYWLDKVMEFWYPDVCWIFIYPDFRNLHGEPKFQEFMDRMGLTNYYKKDNLPGN